MSDPLTTLEQHRDLILLAEIGALIHDLGKLSKEFVSAKSRDGEKEDIHSLFLKLNPPVIPEHLQVCVGARNRVEAALLYLESSPLEGADMLYPLLKGEYEKKPSVMLEQVLVRLQKSNPKLKQVTERVQSFVVTEVDPHKAALTLLTVWSTIPGNFIPTGLVELLRQTSLPQYSPGGAILFSEATLADMIEGHHQRPALRVSDAEYVRLLRARPEGGCDGVDSAIDKAGADEGGLKQHIGDTRIATAFGYEPDSLRIKADGLKKVRHDYANDLALILQRIQTERANLAADHTLPPRFWQEVLYDGWQTRDGYSVKGLRELTERAFRQALGETRRAANDVTLWDHSFSVASLYKAALAKILLEQARNPGYTFPEIKVIRWRLLRVGYDGLGYLEQAHHVTDLLGRQASLGEALDEVKRTLEVTLPVGNEIYRDENGCAFLLPALDGDDDGKILIDLVEQTIREAFLKHLRGEVVPTIVPSPAPSREATELGGLLARCPASQADPECIRQAWQGQIGVEICPVCGLRPQGYTESDLPEFARDSGKTRKRNLCGVCLARRGRRSRDWARDVDGLLGRTIWIDEVADEHNRVALLVGRFGMEDWLNGTHVHSLLAAPNHPKNPSFARLRRMWETTQRFWQEAEEKITDEVLRQEQRRLELSLDLPGPPGKFHVYEARYPFGNLPVVWNPDSGKLMTAINLQAMGRLSELPDKLRGPVSLYEPSSYGQARTLAGDFQVTDVEWGATAYKPYISLLTEPFIFMVLIPANRALETAMKIKTKFEAEMGRVRDRLPVYLGLIFFDRHNPLYAVLDTGRRMLSLPDKPARWTIKEVEDVGSDQRRVLFENEAEWFVPLKMGDGMMDEWYLGSLRTSAPREQIQVHPARFDFLFLDTIARRFDVRLDEETGRRPHPLFGPRHSPRPYLLEDLGRMEQVWQWCWPSGMTTTRLHGIRDLLAARFEEWDLAKKERTATEWQTYEKLIAQVLGKEFSVYTPGSPEHKGLRQAMLDGLFFDCLELHLQILKEKGVQR